MFDKETIYKEGDITLEVEKKEEKKDYIRFSDIKPKEISWLWKNYIPRGMVTMLQGDPKAGKTFLLVDLISRITNGDFFPFSEEKFTEGNVIYLSGDDSPEYSLKDRFTKQRADQSKIYTLDENESKVYFTSLERLENLIKEVQPVLIVLDPIQAYMAKGDSNSITDVRKNLAPLKILAEKYNCAIVLVQHLRKGSEGKAIHMGVGSIDFPGFARSILMVIKKTNNERMLIHTASNISKEGNCYTYQITENGLQWLSDKGEVDVEKITRGETETEVTKTEKVKNFIFGVVSGAQKIEGTKLSKLCNNAGFKSRITDEARSQLNKERKIYSTKENGITFWNISDNSSLGKSEE